MDERMNDLRSLAVLDPARGREPSAMEWTRSQAAVERMMTAGQPARLSRRRWLLAGAAAAVAGVVGAVVVPALIPGAAEEAVASWTAAPTSRTGDQVLPQAGSAPATRSAAARRPLTRPTCCWPSSAVGPLC